MLMLALLPKQWISLFGVPVFGSGRCIKSSDENGHLNLCDSMIYCVFPRRIFH